MSDMLFCFSCCWSEPAPPIRTRRIKIDRSMIGQPQNFVHTVHLGSGDMSSSQNSHISSIQNQMSSKGGYESNGTHVAMPERKVIDVQRTESLYSVNSEDHVAKTAAIIQDIKRTGHPEYITSLKNDAVRAERTSSHFQNVTPLDIR